jgi:D-methionine transport system ATP-binding protein
MGNSVANIISLKDVSVSFPAYKGKNIDAVRNISLEIRKGEVFGIVGTSGAGKSTLLRTINLLQRPTQGQLFVNQNEITGLKGEALRKLRINIGMIFQQFNLINSKTVYENIAFAMKAVGKKKEEIDKRVPEVLELVGLLNRCSSYPTKLSGGEKQRVGIARALANNPEILLCDEPTSALDLETTNAILDLLKEINRKLGITTVIISHEMNVIKKICDRVAVMSNGNILELDNVFNVFTNPKHEFTQALVKHTFDLSLPERLIQAEGKKTLKIVYSGQSAEESIISDTIEKYGIRLNILHGKIEYITDKPYGILVVQLSGSKEQILHAENYLRDKTIKIEEV